MQKLRPFMVAALLLFGLSLRARAVSGQSPALGVLEEVPGVYVGEASSLRVRVVFRREGQGWVAFPSDCPDQQCLKTISSAYPPEITWTISFDGRKVGQVTGHTPAEFKFYAHVGLQEITSGGSVPVVGNRSAEFSGFLDTPVHRPLIANSEPNYVDPEHWKPVSPSTELVGSLRRQFRGKFPKLCGIDPRDETKLTPITYRDDSVKIVKSYHSNRGWWLARLHLDGAIDCNDVEAGLEIDDPWFVVGPQGNPEYLDSWMWLVDAGDYDNDGKSELVFSIDQENRGGYILYFEDFKKRAIFKFGYH
jgi:hypothetical protein